MTPKKTLYGKEIRECFSEWKRLENKVNEIGYYDKENKLMLKEKDAKKEVEKLLTNAIDLVAFGMYENSIKSLKQSKELQTNFGNPKILKRDDFHDFEGTPSAIDEYLKNCRETLMTSDSTLKRIEKCMTSARTSNLVEHLMTPSDGT